MTNSRNVQQPYRVIVDVISRNNYKSVHLQSVMQITNQMSFPVELKSIFGPQEHVGIVEPQKTIYMPISFVQFDQKATLGCRPAEEGMFQRDEISIGEVLRREEKKGEEVTEKDHMVVCEPSKMGGRQPVYFNFHSKVVPVKYENSARTTPISVMYEATLRSLITLANVLPYKLQVEVLPLARKDANIEDVDPNKFILEPGAGRPVYHGMLPLSRDEK